MSGLISLLDKKKGENGHTEYVWSSISISEFSEKNLKESILQLSCQLVRTEESSIASLGVRFKSILRNIQNNKSLIKIVYKLIAQTRDIVDGKGEYMLSYMMISELWNMNTLFYQDMAKQILRNFVVMDKEHPLGSWKDIKFFCYYGKNTYGWAISHPLIQYALFLYNEQLLLDFSATNKSLVSKWIPREKSKKFGWLFDELATLYFKDYMITAVTELQKEKAINKCKTEYRKIISTMNKELDTIQIKQCGGSWGKIDHSKTTSITTMKQTKALLNLTKTGDQRSYDWDRIECGNNFKEFIETRTTLIKGKRVGLNDFTKTAILLMIDDKKNQIEIDLLNAQWEDNSKQTQKLNKVIALVDVSGSMDGEPLNSAIALGIRVAEKSALGKRVLTFDTVPEWHNLENETNFVDMVKSLGGAKWGGSTNFYAAFELILNAIIESNMPFEEVEGLILAIFSDMQMNSASNENPNVLIEVMTKHYSDAGIIKYGKPIPLPHILFWNLRSTTGFPAASNNKNVTMFSGFSPALLNQFCENGIEGLISEDPWSMLIKSLEIPRYEFLDGQLDLLLLG
jgi:hypothetical protein